MRKTFSKSTRLVLGRMGMKFVNALMLASMLFSNATGVARAQSAQEVPAQAQNTKTPMATASTYQAPVFTHPEARMDFNRDKDQANPVPSKKAISYSISCGYAAPGVICTDLGDTLRYDVFITEPGNTQPHILIGSFFRTTSTAPLKILARYTKIEYSDYFENGISDAIALKPFDAGEIRIGQAQGSTGKIAEITQSIEDLRSVYSFEGYPITLGVRGDVDWPNTGATLSGIFYVSGDPNFTFSETDVYSGSIANSGENKASAGGVSENDGAISTATCSQRNCGDPINPRTGSFSFVLPDLSFPTLAGDLIYQRNYSSSLSNQKTTHGYGWTNNHEAGLIFPGDPNGMNGCILFQSPLGNRYIFNIEADGTYTPGAGVIANLVQASGTYVVTTSQKEGFTFDSSGRLISRFDALGHTFTYSYNNLGQLETISADGGMHTITLNYDTEGRVASVFDHAGRQASYAYNAAGNLVSYVDTLGQTWTYQYDSLNRLTQMIAPDQETLVINQYDAFGRVTQQHDGEGNLIVGITYNGNDRTSTVSDGLGLTTTYQSDIRGVNTGVMNPLGNSQASASDANFRQTSVIDEAGRATALAWSADGNNLTRVTDAAGHKTDISYNGQNKPTAIVDAQNHLTTFA